MINYVSKDLAILGGDDGGDRCAAHAHAVALENALVVQIDARVERRLASKLQEQAVRTLAINDLLDVFGRHRQKIDLLMRLVSRLNKLI